MQGDDTLAEAGAGCSCQRGDPGLSNETMQVLLITPGIKVKLGYRYRAYVGRIRELMRAEKEFVQS